MAPVRHEGDRRVPVDNWESHVDRMIRDAQRRGDFDNLPGSGKPLDLEDNPFAGEWQSAYRLAKNAGAAPLWVQLDKEITADLAELQAMGERMARHLRAEALRLGQSRERAPATAAVPKTRGRRWRFDFWRRSQRGAAGEGSTGRRMGPRTLAELEAERRRARALFLTRAAAVDEKIVEFNSQRPPGLTWLEKPRLLAETAAQQFDAACPPITAETAPGDTASG
jgi:Domain of unknown function (DUF1992)